MDCSQPPWMCPQEENRLQMEQKDSLNGRHRAKHNFQRNVQADVQSQSTSVFDHRIDCCLSDSGLFRGLH